MAVGKNICNIEKEKKERGILGLLKLISSGNKGTEILVKKFKKKKKKRWGSCRELYTSRLLCRVNTLEEWSLKEAEKKRYFLMAVPLIRGGGEGPAIKELID